MSFGKVVKNKIESISNTQKITKAMEMISISKFRKMQIRLNGIKPYALTIKQIISKVIKKNTVYKYICSEPNVIKKIGMIVISTDKGLCGSLNSNLFKEVQVHIRNYQSKNIKCYLIIVGLRGLMYFNSLNQNIILKIKDLSNKLAPTHLSFLIEKIIACYQEKCIEKLFIASNKYNNAMSQTPQISSLFPFSPILNDEIHNNHWDYIYEPNSKHLLDILMNRYLYSQIHQSILENLVCEQSARMIAMRTATDNSDNLIKELQLIYNKIRQSSITQELTEIISGASVIVEN